MGYWGIALNAPQSPISKRAVSIPRLYKSGTDRKLEALLSLSEVAPDAQSLEILF